MGHLYTEAPALCTARWRGRAPMAGREHGHGRAVTEPVSPLRVYLVDDEPVICAGLRGLLEARRGFVVCGEAGGEEEALRGILAVRPDLAVVDLFLGQGSGVSLIRRMHKQCPDLKILVFSGYDESHLAASALAAGAHGYLLKGEATTRIIEALLAVNRHECYLSREILERLDKGGHHFLPSR